MLRPRAASPMPLTASRNSPSLSGFSGLPKFRQSVNALGLAPTATMFLQVSSMQDMPPLYGSASVNQGLQPMAAASPLYLSGTGLRTLASPGPVSLSGPTMGWMTVAARTSWSYCLIAHSLDATFGSESMARIASLSLSMTGKTSFAFVETVGSS